MKELGWFLDNREMRRPVQPLGHRNDQDLLPFNLTVAWVFAVTPVRSKNAGT